DPRGVALDRRDALDRRRARPLDDALLEGDDGKTGEGVEELALTKQEIGVPRLAEALVAEGEGLVNEEAAWRQSLAQRGKERPGGGVVGNDDPVIEAAEAPGRTALEAEGDDLASGVAGESREPRDAATDGDDAKAHRAQQRAGPPASRREVENPPLRADQRRE